MLIRSVDIHDQSRKKSKIAPKFGQFFGRHKFFGAGLVKIAPTLSPLPRGTSTKESPVRIFPLARKLLTLKRLILGQILNFRDYIFFRGGPHPTLGCALARLGESLARVKISGRSTP